MAYIVVVAGPHRGEMKAVLDERLVIGRGAIDPGMLNLGNDEYVTRYDLKAKLSGHAVVSFAEGSWRLTDCGSRNKTWVILNGSYTPIAAKSFVRMRPAFLFGCGMSGLLFLDVEQQPTDGLRADLHGTDAMKPSHPIDAPTVTKLLAATETNAAPMSDAAAATARWQQIVRALEKHGMKGLLGP
jgi:hypothetical protein